MDDRFGRSNYQLRSSLSDIINAIEEDGARVWTTKLAVQLPSHGYHRAKLQKKDPLIIQDNMKSSVFYLLKKTFNTKHVFCGYCSEQPAASFDGFA